MKRSGVTTTKDITADILKSVRYMTHSEVLIGVPSNTAEREADDEAPLNNAEIGYLMETGIPEKNVPARPFLVPGVTAIKDRVSARLRLAAEKALAGSKDSVEIAFNAVGLEGQSAVQKKITEGPFVPLSPKTLAARKARGRTGEKPLIDTGSLRQSISYAIRPKGK